MTSSITLPARPLRRLGVLIGVTCVALMGCSTGVDDGSGPGTTTSAAGGPSSSQPTPGADADQEVITAVDATLDAPSFTLASNADFSVGPSKVKLVFEGSVDYPNLIADVILAIDQDAQAVETEIRSDGTTAWVRLEGDAATAVGFPKDKTWVEGDSSKLTEVGNFEQGGLIGVMYTLRAAEDTEVIGTDELDGIDVTRYRTTVTYDDALQAAGSDAEALQASLSLRAETPIDLDIEVAVGSDGVIREFRLNADEEAKGVRLLADYSVTLTDVGEEVPLPDAPPERDTLRGARAESIFDSLGG